MSLKEIHVGPKNSIKNGEMKAVKVDDDNEVLVCNVDGNYYALGAHCTHYGAPLSDGILDDGRIVCPWHHACFNAKNGDLLEPPAMDSLPRFEVKIENDEIKIVIPDSLEQSRVPDMAAFNKSGDKRIFVIVGAGSAGYAAAQAMREAGFTGSIIMITQENKAPYDRPNLSKNYLQGDFDPAWMPLRPDDFYEKYGIELVFNKKIKEINTQNKTIIVANTEKLTYDKLLIATGGIPNKFNIPGSDLKNIFYLRSQNDSDRIIEASKKVKKVVVAGSSFIGLEAAFSLCKRGMDVTVVAHEKVPFEKLFGKEVGRLFQTQHEELGIKFELGTGIVKFEGNDNVKAVILEKGEKIETEMVVAGIGVKPLTDYLMNFDKEKDGSVKVDTHFKAGDDFYAAGDIASFKYWYTGNQIRIEHWRTAQQQGRVAGFNMAGKNTEYKSIPFFWTMQAGLGLRYVGYADEWDETVIWGDIPSKNFIAFYVKEDKVLAASGNGRDKEMTIIEELMRKNKMPSAEILRNNTTDLMQYL